LKSLGGGDGMLSCFPSKFARLANIGSVAKAKQSLETREKKQEKSFVRAAINLSSKYIQPFQN